MKILVIAEKPDMGRNIAAAIEPKAKNMRSYLEGEHYIISWAIGHLVGLAEPDAYDEKYKKWNIGHLPIIPDSFQLVANKRTADQLKVIKELASRCDSIVNACDAGREGQYIFSLIQRYLKLKHPVQRLWISDLTTETIKKGFNELRAEADYHNLTLAASARSEADWLIGMNGTRAFTTKHNELMSVGRVQTPVLALIYDREAEIAAFDSLTFYDVEAMFSQGETKYKGLWQGERITELEQAEKIVADVKGKQGDIDSYEVKEVKEYPHRLYDLTLLQREANSKLNFSAKKTLDIAQSLYEKHKVITYPRTNSNYVTEQNIPEMHKALKALQGTVYDQWVKGAKASYVHIGNKSICNPTKVEDHHAILPTVRRASALSADEQKLYDLIVKRFLSQFYDPARYSSHTIMTKVEQHMFKSNLRQLLDIGWKAIYGGDQQESSNKRKKADTEDAEEVTELDQPFELDATLPVKCKSAGAKEKTTKPPKSYTEGTLLKAMESAGKHIEDDEMREAMKDSGLGTPATRAATIERLKTVGYILMQGKKITITNKGKAAIDLIRGAGVELLTSPEMTGMWEKRLNDIARGQASNEQFMNNVKKFATMIVEKVRVQPVASRALFEKSEPASKRAKGTRTKKNGESAKATTATAKVSTTARATTTTKANGSTKANASPQNEAAKPSNSNRTNQSNVMKQESNQAVATVHKELRGLAPCPNPECRGSIIRGKKDYGCNQFRAGCKVIVRRDVFGHTITEEELQQIIQTGHTHTMKLYTPGGEYVTGRILLIDRTTGELSIDFE